MPPKLITKNVIVLSTYETTNKNWKSTKNLHTYTYFVSVFKFPLHQKIDDTCAFRCFKLNHILSFNHILQVV
jgi:hypothetical protein